MKKMSYYLLCLALFAGIIFTQTSFADEKIVRDYSDTELQQANFNTGLAEEAPKTTKIEKPVRKTVFTVGSLASFQKGLQGAYKNMPYSLNVFPGLSFEPHFLIFEGFAVGCKISGEYTWHKKSFTRYSIETGPTLNYYFNHTGIIMPFIGASVTLGYEKNKEKEFLIKTDSNGLLLEVTGTAGITFMATKNFGIFLAYNFIYSIAERYTKTSDKTYLLTSMSGPPMFMMMPQNPDTTSKKSSKGYYHRAELGFKIFI